MSTAPADIRILTATGPDIRPWIPDAARLRISVFREYPYLYDGDPEYESEYLRTYSEAPGSFFVIAIHGDRVIGVSTGLPLIEGTEEEKAPFLAAGMDPATVFYFGESVLEPEWRGRGIGVRFFEEREARARAVPGIRMAAFCAVDRPADHPARPADYLPLDAFWTKRGFTRSMLQTRFTWKETGEDAESPKPMTFWLKELV